MQSKSEDTLVHRETTSMCFISWSLAALKTLKPE